MLAVHAEGLTSKWAAGRMTSCPAAKDHLGLGEHDRIVGYVQLGYTDETAPPAERARTAPTINWGGM